jgi:hypothetical protein
MRREANRDCERAGAKAMPQWLLRDQAQVNRAGFSDALANLDPAAKTIRR